MIKKISVFISLSCLALIPAVAASKTTQGAIFEAGMNAVISNHIARYRENRDKLTEPVLRNVLYGAYLEQNIENVSAKQVERYLEKNEHLYKAQSIRIKWLNKQANEGNWQSFNKLFNIETVSSPFLQCRWLNRQGDGFKPSAELIQRLWLTTNARPDSCHRVFSLWVKKQWLSAELVKQRALMAVSENKPKLTRYIADNFLSHDDKLLFSSWASARYAKSSSQLAKAVERIGQANDRELASNLIASALDFQTRKSPNHAFTLWSKAMKTNKKLKSFDGDALSGIAARAVLMEAPDGKKWVKKAPYLYHGVASEVAVRDFLRQKQWPNVLDTITKMPEDIQNKIDWQYWRARALEQTGNNKAANKIYQALATKRDFFGFLAADKLGKAYDYNNNPPSFKHSKTLSNKASFKAVKSMLNHGLYEVARLQWNNAIKGFDNEQLASAAKLASDWQFNDRAIITAGQARIFDAVELRFPRAFQSLVEKAAKENNLEPAFVFGIIRQESAFMDQVESHAGALGLMQIMPATGKIIAKQQDNKSFIVNDLLLPEKNIPMGSYYIASRLEDFKQQYPVAIASYNAGPGNAKRWLPNKKMDADVWVESITYRETRKYVKRVLEYTVVYRHLMGLEERKVSDYLGRYITK